MYVKIINIFISYLYKSVVSCCLIATQIKLAENTVCLVQLDVENNTRDYLKNYFCL